MKAIILAGGRGTRLRPLTNKIPKSLIPLNGVPMIERVIQSLKQAGVREIIVVISYKANMIKNYFSAKGIKVRFVNKNIKNKRNLLFFLKNIFQDGKFLLFATDHIFEPKTLKDFISKTKKLNADVVISTCEHEMSGENKIISDGSGNVINILRGKRQHYETGFILYSTKIFEIANQMDDKIKDSTELLKLLLDNGYRIKTLKTPEVYDIDNLYSLKKVERILKKKEMRWSFWVIPPSVVKNQLSKIISQINKKYKVLVPNIPHITVKNEVLLYKEDKKLVENIFRNVCSNTKPFEMKLQESGHSTESHKPVFISVKRMQSLLDFHNNLAKRLYSFSVKPQRDFKNFKPHLSLAYGNLSIATRLKITKYIINKIKDYRFIANEAHIVNSGGKPKNWRILKSFKLGGRIDNKS